MKNATQTQFPLITDPIDSSKEVHLNDALANMKEGGLPGVLEFEIRPEHLGYRRYNAGETVGFFTDREAEPGDEVVAIIYERVVKHDLGKERIGIFEQPIIRILVRQTAEEVVFRSIYSVDALECLPADRVKAIYPIWGTTFSSVYP